MQSQLTIRLPDDLNRGLVLAARRLRLKRADIVRMALERYLAEPGAQEDPAPYNRVKHLLGSVRSGIRDLGSFHREHLLKRMRRDA